MSRPRRRRAAAVAARRSRLLFVGHFGIGNLGNDASLRSAVEMVDRTAPDADVLVACRRPHVVSSMTGLRATGVRLPRAWGSRGRAGPISAMAAQLRDLGYVARLGYAADVVIVPGTGILDDFGGVPFYDWPLLLSVYFGACRAHGGRTLLLSVGAGPARRRSFAIAAAVVARLASYASWRDPGSAEFIARHGGGRSGSIVPDLAFALPRPGTSGPVPHDQPVAVAVMDYRGWWAGRDDPGIRDRLVTLLADTVSWLLEEGHRVRLVAADASDIGDTRDVEAAVRRRRPGSTGRPTLEVSQVNDFARLVAVLADSTAVVATRYHGVVAGLLAGTPTVSVGYADKNEQLMDLVGLGDYCQLIDRANLDTLRDQCRAVTTRGHQLSTTIADAVERFRSRLRQQEDDVAKHLSSGRR